MKSIYDGLQCPVCHARFFEDEDIVHCPVCGAPHHRECWNLTGHCAFEDAHGTDRQWKMPEDEEPIQPPPPSQEPTGDGEPPRDRVGHACPQCGRLSTSDTLFCPYCGHSFAGGAADDAPEQPNPFAPPMIDPLGGVDPSSAVDGQPVLDVATMVAVNTPWYRPRFDRFRRTDNKKKVSWNWSAFFFPSYWLFWRKCYGAGIIALSVSIASRLLCYPFLSAYSSLVPSGATYAETTAILAENMSNIPASSLVMVFGGFVLTFLCSLFFGLFGTYIYKNRCIHKLRQINSPDFEGDSQAALLRSRGVNLFGPLLAMMLLDVLYMLLISFL